MMSDNYGYLNFGLIISVLFLTFAPNAAAEDAKEQLQVTIDRVIEVLRTIYSAEDVERETGHLPTTNSSDSLRFYGNGGKVAGKSVERSGRHGGTVYIDVH